MDKKVTGAWLIHHTNKLQQVTDSTLFGRVKLAGKAGMLLSGLSESDQESILDNKKVQAIATAANIDPWLELNSILDILERNQLISRSSTGDVHILGLTTSTVLTHTSDIFYTTDPDPQDLAVIDFSERVSRTPTQSERITEYLEDTYKLSQNVTNELLLHSEQIGFVDAEELSKDRKLYFNGNLFRSKNARKTAAILDSLNSAERRTVEELEQTFNQSACLSYEQVLKMVDEDLFKKLQSVGMYDVNSVSNELQNVHFITKPAAFGKYGNAMVDDALDLAKAFVTSLTYGMSYSPSSRGKITMLPLLMSRLLGDRWIGPATAIGQDYKVLELKRVVQVRSETGGMFSMRLLKKDVGELAFQALQEGDVSEVSLPPLPGANITHFSGPEKNREIVRKRQTQHGKRDTLDLLRTLRSDEGL